MVDQVRVGRQFMAAHWNHAHAFSSPGDNSVGKAGDNAFGGECDGLQPGWAKPIYRQGGNGYRQPRPEHGNASNIHPLLCFRHGTAENHVLDLGILKPRNTTDGLSDGDCRHVVRARVAQCSLARLSDGGPDSAGYDCFWHDYLSVILGVFASL